MIHPAGKPRRLHILSINNKMQRVYPSLISLTVSVDVKHHVYVLTLCLRTFNRSHEDGDLSVYVHFRQHSPQRTTM